MKYSNVLFSILILSILSSCAGSFPYDHPAINSTYKGTIDFTAIKNSKEILNDKGTLNEKDFIITIHRDDFYSWLGQSSNSNLSKNSQDQDFRTEGVYSYQYNHGSGLFSFQVIKNGEIKITSKRICKVNQQGSGQIFHNSLAENGEITLICSDGIYTGKYIIQSKLEEEK
jgi:hypothetical protein